MKKYFVFIHRNEMCDWKSEQLYPFLLVESHGRMVGKRYDSGASIILETQLDVIQLYSCYIIFVLLDKGCP